MKINTKSQRLPTILTTARMRELPLTEAASVVQNPTFGIGPRARLDLIRYKEEKTIMIMATATATATATAKHAVAIATTKTTNRGH